MNKGTFCTDHFVLGCKLCGIDSATQDKVVVAPLIPTEPAALPVPTGEPIIFSKPEPPKIESEEAQAVVSVTDEYARSCDDLKRANDAVFRMREHIVKMQEALVELVADESSKKNKKDLLKRKVLETLAMGGE